MWDAERRAPAPAPGSGDVEDGSTAATSTPDLDLQRHDHDRRQAGAGAHRVLAAARAARSATTGPSRSPTITGVAADTIRRFARGFAKAPAALILSQWGQCKFLHADLAQRAQILLASLTGNLGRAGGGWRAGGFFAPEGLRVARHAGAARPRRISRPSRAKNYMNPVETEHSFARYFVPGSIWHQVHGGLEAVSGDPRYGDTSAPRPANGVSARSDREEVVPRLPAARPDAAGDRLDLRQRPAPLAQQHARCCETLWPKVKLVVDVNFRMSETGRYADIILPAAYWYEKTDLKYLASFIPYVHLGDRAAPPLGEAKPEWEIFALLAEAVAREARQRNLQPYTDIGEVAARCAPPR